MTKYLYEFLRQPRFAGMTVGRRDGDVLYLNRNKRPVHAICLRAWQGEECRCWGDWSL